MKKRLSCKRIEGAAFIGQETVAVCCYRPVPPLVNGFSGGPIPVEEVLANRNGLRRSLDAGEPCVCSGCSFLEYREWPDDAEKPLFTDSVHICNDYFCNLSCTYCSQAAAQTRPVKTAHSFLPVVDDMIRQGHLSPASVIHFGSGEPTAMPEFADLLRLVGNGTKNKVRVVSNGTLFSAPLAELLREGRARLAVSPDAASREVYYRIKGYDLFERMLANLRKYGPNGLTLKYIVLPENREEGDGRDFLDMAERLGVTEIELSTDYIRLPVSPAELDRYAAMEAAARARGFTVTNFVHAEAVMHHYFDFGREWEKRLALHVSNTATEERYRVPAWDEVLSSDAAFIWEVEYLLTGTEPDRMRITELTAELDAAISRFHYAAGRHTALAAGHGDWQARPLTLPDIWRLWLLGMGRPPEVEEVSFWQSSHCSRIDAFTVVFTGEEFQNDILAAGKNAARISRDDALIVYTLLLGKYPSSEREMLQARNAASPAELAALLAVSEPFRQLVKNAKPLRHMPLASVKIASLDTASIQAALPAWLGGRIREFGEATLLDYWKAVVCPGIAALLPERTDARAHIASPRVLWFGTGAMTHSVLPAMREDRFTILAHIDETAESGASFMGLPVLNSLKAIEDYPYDYILVGARPYAAIRDKLLRAGVPAGKIISLDFEHGAAMLRYAPEMRLRAAVSGNPVLRNAVRFEGLSATDWFMRIEETLQ